MEAIAIRKAEDVRWDVVSLGEVMLRLDPGEGRIHTSRQFTAWEGGGEYNVARGLRRCFGQRAAIVTAFADNPIGRLLEDFILQGGVDTSLIRWVPYDGIGRMARNGLNFTERGFGVRAAAGCSDRGHTAIAQVQSRDFDFGKIFSKENGARWLHTGGIFAALSSSTPQVAIEALDAARSAGTITSFDLNYRESLWKSMGGAAKAQDIYRSLVSKVDVLFGNEEAIASMLGVNFDISAEDTPLERNEKAFRAAAAAYPNLKLIATTLRATHSASRNAWGGLALYQDEMVLVPLREMEILDRVGGGDSFASGLIYGLLAGKPIQWALECGVAHGALAMTTPGDNSNATLAEVERVMKGNSAHIIR